MDKFNILSKTFTHFKHDPGNSNSLSNNDIENLFFDKSGTLWIGTNGSGLDSYNIKTGSFKHYFHNKNNPHSISHNIVFNIYQLPDGSNDNLWIGTGGGGLDLLNISTGKIKVYTESDGLANNEIYGILGDKKGNLWISTNSGISKFDVKSQIFHNYNISDGLQSDEFNQGAYYEDDNGKLYFGGIEGLNVYDPDSITDNTFNPKIVFTSLKIYKNGFKSEQSIVMTRDITLPYNKNIISFRFAALSYSDPNKNQFSYKLKGLNKDWINIGTSNSLTFSSLSPGNYTLFVKGTNNDGLWSKNIAKIKIIITPPLWATWWFRGILIVIMVAFIISIFWYRLNSVRLKNKRLEVLVAERTKELLAKKQELEEVNNKQAELLKLLTKSEEELRGLNANKDKIMSILAHDLRSPFTGLLGYSFMLANEYDQLSPEEIKNNALNIYTISNDFFKLLNNLLEWAMVQSGKINYAPAKQNLNQRVEEIINLFNINAGQKSIKLNNQVEKNVTVWADKDMLEIILRNLISNALKFTYTGGEIRISSKDQNEFVEIIISDTGVGISEEDQSKLFNLNMLHTKKGTNKESGTGLGLNLCRELTIKQGGDIRIESKIEKGTSVIFSLPKESKK